MKYIRFFLMAFLVFCCKFKNCSGMQINSYYSQELDDKPVAMSPSSYQTVKLDKFPSNYIREHLLPALQMEDTQHIDLKNANKQSTEYEQQKSVIKRTLEAIRRLKNNKYSNDVIAKFREEKIEPLKKEACRIALSQELDISETGLSEELRKKIENELQKKIEECVQQHAYRPATTAQ